jgi:hypothetical protein
MPGASSDGLLPDHLLIAATLSDGTALLVVDSFIVGNGDHLGRHY